MAKTFSNGYILVKKDSVFALCPTYQVVFFL